jgi:hypothetical protein
VTTYWSGQGGHAKNGAGVTQPVSTWRLRKTARLADSTTSASGGETRAKVLGGGQGSFDFPWDSDLLPEAAGWVAGSIISSLRLWLGASGLMYSFTAIIESVEIVNDARNDIDRCVVNFFSQGEVGIAVVAA